MTETLTETMPESILDVLGKATFDNIIPRKIYLFGFRNDADVYKASLHYDYTVTELTLTCATVLNFEWVWTYYVDNYANPEEYTYRIYVDEDGREYRICVDAIARRKKFADGTLPYAYFSPGMKHYADIIPELELPGCLVA